MGTIGCSLGCAKAKRFVGGIRIDIQPTNADQPARIPRSKQHLAAPATPMRAAGPFLDEPVDNRRSGLLAIGQDRRTAPSSR